MFNTILILLFILDPLTGQGIKEPDEIDISRSSDYAKTIEFIKKHEGFRANAYHCTGGYLTIGYGQIIKYEESLNNNSVVTKKQAEKILIKQFEKCLNLAKLHFQLEGNKQIAIAHLIYCKGIGSVLKYKVVKDQILDIAKMKTLKYQQNRKYEIEMFNK